MPREWTPELVYESLKKDLDGLTDKFKERLESQQHVTNEALKHHEIMLERMTESFEKRLKELNGIRETFREHTLTSMPRAEAMTKFEAISARQEASIETLASKQAADLKPIQEKLDAFSKPNWQVYGISLGLIVTLLGGAWSLINMEINVVSSPLHLATEQLKATDRNRDRQISELVNDTNKNSQEIMNLNRVTASSVTDRQQTNERLRIVEQFAASSQQADAQSKQDRSQLNQRVKDLEISVANGQAERKSQYAEIKTSLIEIESQFRGVESVMALLKEHTGQFLSLLWEKVFPGEKFPFGTYNPILHKDN